MINVYLKEEKLINEVKLLREMVRNGNGWYQTHHTKLFGNLQAEGEEKGAEEECAHIGATDGCAQRWGNKS